MTREEFREQQEALVREQLEAGQLGDAIETTLQTYGEEILGYIAVQSNKLGQTEDVFQQFSIAVWQSLERFEWKSTLRTWLYAIARRTIARAFRDNPGRRERRLMTDEQRALNDNLTRTITARWQRTASKHWLREILAEFDPDDQQMLVLRLQQKMSWREIAQVLADEDLEPADITRRAAALRKRYERTKTRLMERREELMAASARPEDDA